MFQKRDGVGIARNALEHQRGRAVGERTVDDIAVAGDPAHVRRAPVDVAVMVVEHVLVRDRRVDEIATRRMHDALGASRRAGGVEDEEGILRAHLDRRAVGVDLGHLLVQPQIAARRPRNRVARATHDQHFLAALGAPLQGLVGVLLERYGFAAARALVRRDDEFAVGVLDAAREAFGRKAAEDDRVNRADARAGEHGVRRLGNHRQVDRDAVALFDPIRLQHVGES